MNLSFRQFLFPGNFFIATKNNNKNQNNNKTPKQANKKAKSDYTVFYIF